MQKLAIKFWAWFTNTMPVELIEIDGKINIAYAIKASSVTYAKFNGKPIILKPNGGIRQDFPFTIRAWRYYE